MESALGCSRIAVWALTTAVTLSAGAVSAAERAADRLLHDLMALESFRAHVPANHEIDRLDYLGQIRFIDFVYTRVPDTAPLVPRAIGTTVAGNCDPEATLVVTGEVTGSRTESAALTTTRGWQVGGSVSFGIKFPLVGKTEWTFSASYSESTAQTTETVRSRSVTRGFESPVLPRTEHDIQLVVFEEQVDGIPYRLDLAMEGRARIHHRLKRLWVPRNELRGSGFTGGRDGEHPPICRAYHVNTTHPGKVVAGFCHITWAGAELRKSVYEVLVNDPEVFKWDERTYTNGETNEEKGLVAGVEPYRMCKPGSLDYQDCHQRDPNEGKLYVCAAKYGGEWHPGKLVIRDCMIGYGGQEILIGSYRILTYRDVDAHFDIDLAGYLPPERLVFTIEGDFEGVAASSGQIVRGASRPVSDALCNLRPGSAVRMEAASGSATVTRPQGAARTRAVQGQRLIDGTVILRGDFDDSTLTHDVYVIRQLEPQTPPLFGDDVLLVQQALVKQGWPVRPDGFYGPRTVRAVRAFQRANNLTVDGIVGGATLFWLGLAENLNPVTVKAS